VLRARVPILICGVLWLFGASLSVAGSAPARQKSSCESAQGASSGEVASVEDRLELRLADGRLLQIAGIDAPGPTPQDPDLAEKARMALASWLVGRDIFFHPLSAEPDRWGRRAAFVFADAAGNAAPLPVAAMLVDAGFARVKPHLEAHACRTAWLAAEAAARDAALGLWADPYYAVLAAVDTAAFPEKSASFVIVEGRVAAVTQTPQRLRIGFAGSGKGRAAFSVTLMQRNVRIFDAAGIDLHALIHRTLRVRGLLDLRFGPQIEISNPDEIEVIADDAKSIASEADAPPAAKAR